MDVRQAITDKIIALMEKGGAVFAQRWVKSVRSGMPINGKTRQRYTGANVLLLLAEATEKDYVNNVWLTFKQAQDMGAQVHKGAKGVMCAYFKKIDGKGDDEEATAAELAEDAKKGAKSFLMCKPFWVFNIEQIDNLPVGVTPAPVNATNEFQQIDMAEKILGNSGAVIHHQGDNAFYRAATDEIFMPPRERFVSAETYYATTVHELTHWTGHESRLNRDASTRFGSDSYAFEELVAELGAAFVCGACGFVDATIEGHTSYLASWLKVLKNDKSAIFTAAKQANAAYDFLMQKAGLLELETRAQA